MKCIKKYSSYFLFVLCFYTVQVFGQHKVEIKAKVSQDGSKVLLRWAPSTPLLWKLANSQTAGYQLKKYRVFKNGQLLDKPILDSTFTVVLKTPVFSHQDRAIRNIWFSKFMHSSVLNMTYEQLNPVGTGNIDKENDAHLIIDDQYAMLWASIYGDTFSASGKEDLGIVDMSSEQDKRFNMALAVTDFNFEAAKFVGLALEDNAVVAGEKYLYEVSALVSGITVQKGTVYIGMDDKENLTTIPPYEVNVAFVDSVAKINWNTSMLDHFYSGYDVYRSDNGTTFRKLNDRPLVKVGNDIETSITYTDSLVIKDGNLRSLNLSATYYYKVVGKTPFGEDGKHSDVVSGKVRLFLHEAPYITDAEVEIRNADSLVVLNFTFPALYNPAVNTFLISYSTTSSTTGYTYLPTPVSKRSDGTYTVDITTVPVRKTTFFRVSAIPFHGDQQDSNPEMVEPLDATPPLAPVILSVINEGIFQKNGDSLMVVKITWQVDMTKKENTDIGHYRIFRANNENEEPSQITNMDNLHAGIFMYRDTIVHVILTRDFNGAIIQGGKMAKSLNHKIFYQIRAVDKRENQGPLSERKFLQKPDKIPLPPVVIGDYSMGDDGIGFSWSGYDETEEFYVDFDFSKYTVLRAEIQMNQMEAIQNRTLTPTWMSLGEIFDPLDSSYFDEGVARGKIYAYVISSTDLSNNVSFSRPLFLEYKPKTSVNNAEPAVQNFTASKLAADKFVKLSWQHTSQKALEYVIYRATSSIEPLKPYQVLKATDREYFDRDIKTGSTYHYGIVVNYPNDTHSRILKSTITF